jgi:hypothetical protein
LYLGRERKLMPIDAKDKDVQWMRAALENKVVPAIGSDDVSLLRVFSLSLSLVRCL